MLWRVDVETPAVQTSETLSKVMSTQKQKLSSQNDLHGACATNGIQILRSITEQSTLQALLKEKVGRQLKRKHRRGQSMLQDEAYAELLERHRACKAGLKREKTAALEECSKLVKDAQAETERLAREWTVERQHISSGQDAVSWPACSVVCRRRRLNWVRRRPPPPWTLQRKKRLTNRCAFKTLHMVTLIAC